CRQRRHSCFAPGGPAMSARWPLAAALLLALPLLSSAADLPRPDNVELQPLAAQVKRVVAALELLGNPLPEADRKAIDEASKNTDKKQAVLDIQAILDRHCLVAVKVQGDKFVGTETIIGPAKAELAQQGWRTFLVKVINESGRHDAFELRPE